MPDKQDNSTAYVSCEESYKLSAVKTALGHCRIDLNVLQNSTPFIKDFNVAGSLGDLQAKLRVVMERLERAASVLERVIGDS